MQVGTGRGRRDMWLTETPEQSETKEMSQELPGEESMAQTEPQMTDNKPNQRGEKGDL